MPEKKKEMTFEEAYRRLEEIVQLLERGDTGLEEAMKSFEEGIALARWCMKRLNREEERLKVLVRDMDGGLKLDDAELGAEPEG